MILFIFSRNLYKPNGMKATCSLNLLHDDILHRLADITINLLQDQFTFDGWFNLHQFMSIINGLRP